MKKSEFKQLVKEAMLEILPELMEIMAENINESYTPQPSVRQKPDLTLVRQHAASASSGGGYELDENDIPLRPRQRAKSTMPTPQNPREIIDGEVFASGEGIMEWFQGAGGKQVQQSEFKHSTADMDTYMAEKFGVK